jgi:O-acetyl-ADP-ribose deacetylase (regulator of RNase III)
MINYIKGDLFAAKPKIIVHGCNAHGVMGSGFAKTIKELYPKAYTDYQEYCKLREKEFLLGTVKTSLQPDGTLVINAITQGEYGRGAIRYVSYDAVDDCMETIGSNISEDNVISMPKIGAGLGNGNWNVIEAIIKHRLKDHVVNVYEL